MWNTQSAVVKGMLVAILAVVLFGCGNKTQLAMLVPDDAVQTDPKITVWADAAWEEGVSLSFLTDSQFLALGDTALTQYPGIILPDVVHTKASAALIQALTSYASAGGWLMLTYDFGTLDENGLYPISDPSRLSSLAGIDYVFYSALRDKTIGLGPIAGASSVLRTLQVQPGKSMPITTTVPATTTTSTVTALAARVSTAAADTRKFLPSSVADPGGLRNYNHAAQFETSGNLTGNAITTRAQTTTTNISTKLSQLAVSAAASSDVQEQISGYVYGPLTYPTFVTADSQGYTGTVLMTSTFGYDATNTTMTTSGIAAGLRIEGKGGVVFVNTPLSYLVAETDGMLMHGFLRYFAASVLKLARLSDHPNGRGGLVFNWHFDAEEAIAPAQTLDTNHVWDRGPFSIHFTAGPDNAAIGDGLGMNVPTNTVVQDMIKYFVTKNYQIASHGGWDHNLYGIYATEDDENSFLPGSTTLTFLNCLVLNAQAIEAVLGRSSLTEYSAPQGNNPLWAMNWLESTGVVGYYFAGDTGLGPTRAYRPTLENPALSKMSNPTMWAFPVSPFGKYAVFEEFEDNGVASGDIINWYTDLVNFVVQNRTSRLIYAHPPGAVDYLDAVLIPLFTLTDSLSATNQFQWYTITDLAKFEARRLQVDWGERSIQGFKFIAATHPTDLSGFTWVLPQASYSLPSVVSGTADITSDTENWIVTAKSGTYLMFYSVQPTPPVVVPAAQ